MTLELLVSHHINDAEEMEKDTLYSYGLQVIIRKNRLLPIY
jgi:hypothetical protein